MTTTPFVHDPNAVLDYGFDWAKWLAAGETIATATVTVPSGITKGTGDKDVSHTDTAVTVWLSGGSAGTTYPVTCHITSSQGRQDDRTIQIRVRER